MRTLLAGETEDVCPGVGDGVTDSSGKIEGVGDSTGMEDGVGVGDSCAKRVETTNTVKIARCAFFVISGGRGKDEQREIPRLRSE